MANEETLKITGTDRKGGGNELIVEYSDKSSASYTVAQLRDIEPKNKVTDGVPMDPEK
jgi:hypothetical protein